MLLFLSFPDSLLFGGGLGVGEERRDTKAFFGEGGKQHQLSNWWRSGGKLKRWSEESVGHTGNPFPNHSDTPFRSSTSSKSSPTQHCARLPITSSLPVPSWKSEIYTNPPATAPEEARCSCSFSWDSRPSPLWVLTTQKQNTFCLRHSWRKMIMVS